MKICDLELERKDIRRAVKRGWKACGFPALANGKVYQDLIVEEVWRELQKSEDRGGD